jgi:hypothetical protein
MSTRPHLLNLCAYSLTCLNLRGFDNSKYLGALAKAPRTWAVLEPSLYSAVAHPPRHSTAVKLAPPCVSHLKKTSSIRNYPCLSPFYSTRKLKALLLTRRTDLLLMNGKLRSTHPPPPTT